MVLRPRPRASLLSTTSIALAATLVTCGGEPDVPVVDGVIDRETFIEVYVDLRAETVQGSELTLEQEERDSILARHGVGAQDLLDFVEAYGRELDYMNELWADVERRLEARPAIPPPDQPIT